MLLLDLSLSSKQNLQIANEDRIDFDLLEQLIVFIDRYGEEGAILVFLPGKPNSKPELHIHLGIYEINKLFDRLCGIGRLDPEWLIRLHSSMTPEEQARAFSIPPTVSRTAVSNDIQVADFVDFQISPSNVQTAPKGEIVFDGRKKGF